MDYDELVKDLRNYSLLTIDPLSTKIANAADAIEELLEKIEQLPRWISTKEQLPKKNVWVLEYCKDKDHVVDYVDVNGLWSYGNVTHWMPLPTPPKEEQA